MKRFAISAVLATALLTSCGTTDSSNLLSGLASLSQGQTSTSTGSSSQSTTGSLLGGLLSSLLAGSNELTAESIAGTWKYTGSACAFETENFLMKAGGAVASNKITSELDTQLARVGIKSGSCTFVFDKDGTFKATIGSRTINGQYTLDAEAQTMQMTFLGGLSKMTPKVTKTGNTMKLLFESDKLLSLVQTVSTLTGTSTGSTISQLLGAYDGLYVGFNLQK